MNSATQRRNADFIVDVIKNTPQYMKDTRRFIRSNMVTRAKIQRLRSWIREKEIAVDLPANEKLDYFYIVQELIPLHGYEKVTHEDLSVWVAYWFCEQTLIHTPEEIDKQDYLLPPEVPLEYINWKKVSTTMKGLRLSVGYSGFRRAPPKPAKPYALRDVDMSDTATSNAENTARWVYNDVLLFRREEFIKLGATLSAALGLVNDYTSRTITAQETKALHRLLCAQHELPYASTLVGDAYKPNTVKLKLDLGHKSKGMTEMKPHILEDRKFLDGSDLTDVTDGHLVAQIAEIEKEIETLKKLKTESKKVSAHIEHLEDTAKKLAEYLDGRGS